jgi:hypothetical protein
MTDETTGPEGSNDTNDETATSEAAGTGAPEAGDDSKHGLKQDLRDGVAKVVGYTVEVASILGQQGGPAVEAEREVAEANTEQFIDRIDGED